MWYCPPGRSGSVGVSGVHAESVFSFVSHGDHDGPLHSFLHGAHLPEPQAPPLLEADGGECQCSFHHVPQAKVSWKNTESVEFEQGSSLY